ncbi:substrate-binding domain-containing protein [Bartonella sp. HY329]|uniref:substrate-binding domain-containing protein n=1 Tax=unclassified Bartonella TaxID=2645622 RepID=UPI0021C6B14D|nr:MULTISPECIES: substrate-binding domain-containing protein [unclassified Bartonella]UXM94038.1 substrate-binding domain-containing protein [Bartonella sp. HY329]UXN08360.1 substrate-binding domain-containing protein [Bartonella sp. HY328]
MKYFKSALAGIAVWGLFSGLATAQDSISMGIVGKIGGIPWTNSIETGMKKQADEMGVKAELIGPVSSDPSLQVRAIEDLIARKVDVIGIVPNDSSAIEPVLQKARAAGIKVIANEGPNLKNIDWNFDLVSSKGLGEAHAKLLAEKLGGKGKYAVYVGSLTVPLHNAWADAAIAYIKENYPDMIMVGDRYGVAESVDDSRKTTIDLMAAHPDLAGIMAFGSQGPIGAGRAVAEQRKIGKVIVIGTFSAGQGRTLVKSGAITAGYTWSPEDAGRVFVILGKLAHDGVAIKDGMDIPVLGKVSPNFENKNIVVDNLLLFDKASIDKYAQMGL